MDILYHNSAIVFEFCIKRGIIEIILKKQFSKGEENHDEKRSTVLEVLSSCIY